MENKGYLGSHYTDFWAFRVAELLDCRTYKLMTFDDQRYVVNEFMVNLVPTSATTTSIRQAPSARRAMSEKEKFLASGTSTTVSPPPPAGGI